MSSKPNLDTEKAAIEQVIGNSIGWAANKDLDLLYRSLANDSSLFIFHPDNASTIVGFPAFKAMAEQFFMNPAFKAVGYSIRNLRITLSPSGDVAWYSAILDDRNEWNGRPASWFDTRWTGVLEKKGGNWKIVQMHFSFATDAKPSGEQTGGG
jgi:ketosteroid isomerase-like protein